MIDYNGKSLTDIAEMILLEKKEPVNMYELFDMACERKGIQDGEKALVVSQFYTDLTSSAKFIYLGDNEWDIKGNQDVGLWEKDGSYYKEYNEVEIPVEVVEEKKEEVKPVVVKPVIEPVVEEVKEEVKVEPVVTEEVDAKALYETQVAEEELFEEYEDDFDEEKYNEYMDTYEDQYDD